MAISVQFRAVPAAMVLWGAPVTWVNVFRLEGSLDRTSRSRRLSVCGNPPVVQGCGFASCCLIGRDSPRSLGPVISDHRKLGCM